jgi:hypothetical protein
VAPEGGGACTFAIAVPVFVSLVAVIVVDPAPTPLTKPVELTEAMLEFVLDHVTTRPGSTLLLASRVTAENWPVPPTRRLDDAGETVTVATGAGAEAVVVADATFERLPNTASWFSVPRNGISWKL